MRYAAYTETRAYQELFPAHPSFSAFSDYELYQEMWTQPDQKYVAQIKQELNRRKARQKEKRNGNTAR